MQRAVVALTFLTLSIAFSPSHSMMHGGTIPAPTGALSPLERERIERMLAQNLRALRTTGRLPPARPGTPPPLRLPVRAAPTLSAADIHVRSNFVDHAAGPGALSDFFCYGRSYDLSNYDHSGTDFAAWPFGWKRMDEDAILVVAAAGGILVGREDGADDRSCTLGSQPWNAAYIRHDDGSFAWYGHLKRGTVIDAPLGSRIAAGDVLGIVGSSGSSTGPHLHFELRAADNSILDPFFDGSSGHDCNPTVSGSLWEAQPPYYDSAILLLTVGDAPPDVPACPSPESPNVRSDFSLDPFSGAQIYVTAYYRDLLFSQTTEYALHQPDGALFTTWSSAPGAGTAFYWWSPITIPPGAPAGTWHLQATHAGAVHHAWFNVDDPIVITVAAPAVAPWPIGRAQTIRWTDNLGGPVRIELRRAGAYVATIEAAGNSDGTAGFTMPTVPCGPNYFIRIADAADPAHFADSSAFRVSGCVYVPAVVE
jgi:murein DD-endopeptidase MepM/ murein hydrolase activator NlpD